MDDITHRDSENKDLLFNVDQLNKIGNNNQDFVNTMLSKFIQTATENTENMLSGLASGDFTKLMGAAHKSIPSYHMIGLYELMGHLQHIELHAREGTDLTDLGNRVQKVVDETQKVIASIKNYLEVPEKKTEKIIP